MSTITKETLAKFEDIDHLSQFLNNVANNISNDESPEPQDQDLKILEKLTKTYFRQRAIEETHPPPPELPPTIQKALETAFKIHHSTIINTLIKEKLVSNGHNIMENYDWKLRWILGSSKLANIREPICRLELYCKDSKDKNLISFECTYEQVEELIGVLENVKKEIDEINYFKRVFF